MTPRIFAVFSPVLLALAGSSLAACALTGSLEHHALVRSAELPPLGSPVLHSNRLWVELAGVNENSCVAPGGARQLCFERLRPSLGGALAHTLWTSFPSVEFGNGDRAPGDYVLSVDLGLEALPPDAQNPGWSAGARGAWRLSRDGQVLAGEQVSSRSRGDFAYGAPLGAGAGEVVDAVAVRIGMALGAYPESHRVEPHPLPAVATAPLAPAVNASTSSEKPKSL